MKKTHRIKLIVTMNQSPEFPRNGASDPKDEKSIIRR